MGDKISLITWSKSEYGLMILNHAQRVGIEVETVILLDYSAFHLARIFHKLFIRHFGLLDGFIYGLQRYLFERSNKIGSTWKGQPFIRDFNKLANQVVFASNIKDPQVEHTLSANGTGIVILGQCELIPLNIINIPDLRILNAHCGKLPEYRGNHVVYWTCYNADFDKIGYTIHLVDKGADTGPILKWNSVKPEEGDNLKTLEQKIYAEQACAIVDIASQFRLKEIKLEHQKLEDGHLYFAMPLNKRLQAEKMLHSHICSQEKN